VTDLPQAGFWRLWAAGLLDSLIGTLAWALGGMWLVLAVWGVRGTPLELRAALLLALAVLALGPALHVLYHVLFIGGCGQTLGKMAVGIAVVRRDGSRPGYGRACVRSLGGVVLLLTLGLAHLLVLFGRERRSVGDLFAGTRIVRVRS
jgi:uncharacterized RDD family membrane protein YckC